MKTVQSQLLVLNDVEGLSDLAPLHTDRDPVFKTLDKSAHLVQTVPDRIQREVEHLVATTVSVTEARQKLHTIIERVQRRGESYIVKRYGEPVAAVVPVSVYENCQRQTFFNLVRDLQKEADLSPEEADRVAGDVVTAIRDEG